MASNDNSWLEYPASIRLMLEEKNAKDQHILIGSDQEDPTYSRWTGTFVVNRADNFFIVELGFNWPNIDEYPKISPTFDFSGVNPDILGKIKDLFDKDNKLKVWNGLTSIQGNLKQIHTNL